MSVKKKVCIITAILVPESWEKTDEEIEADIRAGLRPESMPWVEKIEKITVLSGG